MNINNSKRESRFEIMCQELSGSQIAFAPFLVSAHELDTLRGAITSKQKRGTLKNQSLCISEKDARFLMDEALRENALR